MRQTIHKYFWAWNYDKEEAWLNEMAAKGLSLVAVGFGTYVFEEGTPGEYCNRIELLENLPKHIESRQYIKFLEETGAEYIGSVMRWAYFRKKRSMGGFELYSDYSAHIKYLNRILALLIPLLFVNFYNGIWNILSFFKTTGSHINLCAGILALSIGICLLLGTGKIFLKKSRLKKESQLFE